MAEPLTVRVATDPERREIFRQTYVTWGDQRVPIDEEVESRMNSKTQNRATWYAGWLGNRQVCGLGAYPVELRLKDTAYRGIAIASVHTDPEFRGRGCASQLLPLVEAQEIQRGARVGILYSDIAPAFYERLGYRLCQCWEGWRSLENETATSQPTLQLERLSPDRDRQRIADLYRQHHSRFATAIVREDDYWNFVFQKGLKDAFYGLRTSSGDDVGYVLLAMRGDAAYIRDWATSSHEDQFLADVFQAVCCRAKQGGAVRVGGWLPRSEVLDRVFEFEPRTRELTMIKALTDDVEIDEEIAQASENIREIDHV